FNSMLLHLLQGRFDVDPQTIGDEGSLRNGLTYTYFGIALALIRLPLLALGDFATTDFTRLSCLVAAGLMAPLKFAWILVVWRNAGRSERAGLLVPLALATLLGGAEIQFLRALIYQEAMLWAAALASGFVLVFLRGYYSERGFTAGNLSLLAVIAG